LTATKWEMLQAAIKEFVDKECDMLLRPGSSVDNLCKKVLDHDMEKLIHALGMNPTDASAVCHAILMC